MELFVRWRFQNKQLFPGCCLRWSAVRESWCSVRIKLFIENTTRYLKGRPVILGLMPRTCYLLRICKLVGQKIYKTAQYIFPIYLTTWYVGGHLSSVLFPAF